MTIVSKRMKRRGIDFVINEDGDKKAVVINLKFHKELWEDFYDTLLVRERKAEPRGISRRSKKEDKEETLSATV